MFRIKKTPGAIKTYTASLLPISLSIVGAIRHSPILIVLMPIALLISVALTPWARKRENICMFLLVAVSGVPVNIIVIRWLLGLSFFETHFFVLAFFSQCCIVSHASLYGRTDPRRCYKDDLEESVQNIILKVMLIFEELASGNAQSEFEIILISLHVITLERTFASLLKE